MEHARRSVSAAAAGALEQLTPAAAPEFWRSVAAGATERPVTLRLGAPPSSLADALDLVSHHLDDGWLSVSVGAAALRWSGAAPPDRLRLLRAAAAQQEFPVTVERAPGDTLRAVGHFGAYREGIAPLVAALRRAFDPQGVLAVPTGDG